MKKTLLASVALLAFVIASPALAARDHGDHGAGTHQGGGGHQGGGHQGGGLGGGGHQAGGHQGRGQGGAAIILPGAGGTGRHDRGGHSNTGGTTGGINVFGTGGRGSHAGRGHNSAFDSLRRVFNAPHHYRHGGYNRPHGWYAHRWSYGEFLPALFFSRNYWISDYEDFDLSDPPPGTTWVRYGDDALLIDEYSGEVIQVVYGIFY